MVKYTQCGESVTELEEAVETMLSVLKYVNDMMHQVAITGYDVSLSLCSLPSYNVLLFSQISNVLNNL